MEIGVIKANMNILHMKRPTFILDKYVLMILLKLDKSLFDMQAKSPRKSLPSKEGDKVSLTKSCETYLHFMEQVVRWISE